MISAVEVEPTAGVYLRSCLSPFDAFLTRPDITDIYVNQPGEIWIEVLGGGIERHEDPSLTELVLARLARQIAALSHQGVNRENPLLAAVMPDGSRIQICAPPATRGPMAVSIRRQVQAAMTLADYQRADQFAETRTASEIGQDDAAIDELINQRNFVEGLGLAVRARKNIVVSGGTSTGKTTFLNALLREVPQDERLVLIEDTPELIAEHPNLVGLVCVRGALGEAKVTTNDLVSTSLRMRPDRIILGELRGSEALAFLRAVNTGHPGSMTTVHADSADGAIEQLVMLGLESGTRLTRADIRHFVINSVDLFVHLSRRAGQRRVESVVFNRRRSATEVK